tara:strand:+ start:1415 stop:2083 length:669 start_codon:yes stop_codon:yes gene_type:complete
MKKTALNFTTFIISFCLIGCSVIPTNKIAPGYVQSYKAIKNVLFGFEDLNISNELIQNIPYASLILKIGKGPQGLVILESVNQDQLTWVSADGVYLVTEYGRIVSTRGLPNNLISILNQRSSLKDVLEEGNNESNYYSYDKPLLRNLHIKSTYEIGNKEEVKILDKTFLLRVVYERGRNEYLGWSFTNKYWIDENYYIWKSEQFISPKLPKISILITKKPSY